MGASGKLTRNQEAVLGALTGASAPLSAYDILDRVREQGLRSPLQVYRALKPLMEQGHVHRLESVSAFVACAHPHHDTHGGAHAVTAFAICGECGCVEEFSDAIVAGQLKGWADAHGFRTAGTTVEMRGTCRICAGP